MHEGLATKIARYETADLDETCRIALAYADAHMQDPGRMDGELPEQLRRAFSGPQIVELALDVVAWNQQKILVALGTDGAVDEDRLAALSFDAAGHSVVG